MNVLFYFTIFKHLLHAEFIELKQSFIGSLINTAILNVCTILVLGYLMSTQFNMGTSFGLFTLAGCVANAGLWNIFPRVASLLSDFEGDKHISYQLTLPFPSWMIFIKLIIYYTLSSIAVSIFVLPLGKILLWNTLNLAMINWLQFACIFIMGNIFYAAFTLWVTSLTKDVTKLESVWVRFIFPLWFLGCSQNSWEVFHNFMPIISKIILLNPIVYIMEGMRAAILGQQGYLPFWHCCCALVGFIMLFAWAGIRKLKKRLDFV